MVPVLGVLGAVVLGCIFSVFFADEFKKGHQAHLGVLDGLFCFHLLLVA